MVEKEDCEISIHEKVKEWLNSGERKEKSK